MKRHHRGAFHPSALHNAANPCKLRAPLVAWTSSSAGGGKKEKWGERCCDAKQDVQSTVRNHACSIQLGNWVTTAAQVLTFFLPRSKFSSSSTAKQQTRRGGKGITFHRLCALIHTGGPSALAHAGLSLHCSDAGMLHINAVEQPARSPFTSASCSETCCTSSSCAQARDVGRPQEETRSALGLQQHVPPSSSQRGSEEACSTAVLKYVDLSHKNMESE
eukprot:1160616-Pelagomonas_calceolata.AAC.8